MVVVGVAVTATLAAARRAVAASGEAMALASDSETALASPALRVATSHVERGFVQRELQRYDADIRSSCQ